MNPGPRASRLVLFYLALALVAAPFTFQAIVSNDVAKSLYTGRYIARTFSFPTHGDFSFMPVRPGVLPNNAWTWLGNLVLYGIWAGAGFVGLQGFRGLLLLGSLAVLHAIVRFRTSPLLLLLFAATIFGLEQKLLLRNALFLIPGLCVFFGLWHGVVHRGRTGWIPGFPLLLTLWGNLHGSYLVGVALLPVMIGGLALDYVRGNTGADRWTLGALSGAWALGLAGVTFVKPLAPDLQAVGVLRGLWRFGRGGLVGSADPAGAAAEASRGLYGTIKGFLQGTVFRHVGGASTTYSTEFLFPPEHLDQLYVLTSVGLILLGVAAFLLGRRRLRLSLLLPALAASLVGMAYLRTVALIPLTIPPLLLMKIERGDFEGIAVSRRIRSIAAGALLLVAGSLWYSVLTASLPTEFAPTSYRVFGPGVHPRLSGAVPRYLLRRYPRTRFFNSYNLGSWLIWKWWPDKKVFMDSKNSGYRSDFRRDVLTKSAYRLITDHDMDHAVLTLSEPVVYFHFIPDPEWRLLALDQGMIAFRKSPPSPAAAREPLRTRLLLSRREWNRLPRGSRIYLRRILNFVRRHADRPGAMGRYSEPPAPRGKPEAAYPF